MWRPPRRPWPACARGVDPNVKKRIGRELVMREAVQPDKAEQVPADVAATGRRALNETGRRLHVRRDDASEPHPPT